MEATEQIAKLKEFIEDYYKKQLLERIKKDERYLKINFSKLIKFNPELADDLLEQPEEVIKATEIAIEEFDTLGDVKNFKARFYNLPKSSHIGIGEVRHKYIDKFLQFEGTVLRAGNVMPMPSSTKWECPVCGSVFNVLQMHDEDYKTPTRCSCGRNGKFRLINTEWKNIQYIIAEEYITDYTDKKARPTTIKVLLEYDLTNENLTKKLQPSTHIKFTGIVEAKRRSDGRTKNFAFHEFRILCNYIVVEDMSLFNLKVPESYVKEFKKLKDSPNLISDIAQSLCYEIEGQDVVKEILAISRARGIKTYHQDGKIDQRDTINVFMIGNPGCNGAETLVTLSNGEFKRISQMGEKHLQNIDRLIQIEKRHKQKKHNFKAKTFFKYENISTKVVTLSSGKELICSYNHPLLIREKYRKSSGMGDNQIYREVWKKASDLSIGNKVRVAKKIDCSKTSYDKIILNKKYNNKCKDIILPLCDEKVGFLFGYVIGDGCIKVKKSISVYFNEFELDLLDIFKDYMKDKFNIKAEITIRSPKNASIDGREIKRTQNMYILNYHSKKLTEIFEMDKQPKRKVPDIILSSKNSVVSSFLKGLFDADGSCFISKRKDRRDGLNISLKSSSHQLLLDVQTLLLRFGIYSSINKDNLLIARRTEVKKFKDYIGFMSKKKSSKLEQYKTLIEKKGKEHKTKLYEKIKSIKEGEVQTVYDIEVEKVHKFIANGIISHNSGKTHLAKLAVKVDLINMVVSGKGVSGAGLTASFTHDKELQCWCADPGAIPRCNNGSIVIDELDKIDDKDTSAMNEGMTNLSFMVAKAGLQVNLPSDVGIIGCANPDGRKFDNMIERFRQITLKPDFLDRFDIWVAVEKVMESKAQRRVIGKIISRFKKSEKRKTGKYNLQWLQYYYAWVIQNFQPEIIDELEDFVTDEVSKVMNRAGKGERNNDISYRLVGNIIRFSIAIAKLLQCEKVNKSHIMKSIGYQLYGFKSLDMVDEQGKVSEEKIQFEEPVEGKRKKYTLIDLIRKEYDEKKVPVLDKRIEELWENEGNDPKEVNELLEKLSIKGDIFEPKRGCGWRPL